MMTETQPTVYAHEDVVPGLRVVLEGVGPNGDFEKLTKLTGDGKGRIALEATVPSNEAVTALESAQADRLLKLAAADLGVARPGFEFESPMRWVLNEADGVVGPTQRHGGKLIYRQFFRFRT